MEKEISVMQDRQPRSAMSAVSERSGRLFCLLPHGSDAVEKEGLRVTGSDGERLEPERGSLWQGGSLRLESHKMSRGYNPVFSTRVHMRTTHIVCEIGRQG